MLSLDPNLQSAQDGMVHHPILSLVSSKAVDDIPFLGNIFSGDKTGKRPKTILHSSGSIIGLNLIYVSSTVNHLEMFKTDTQKVTFTTDVPIILNQTVRDFAIAEMPDGNIAVVYIRDNSGNYEIRRMVIDQNGNTVVSNTLISSSAGNKIHIGLIKLANDTYVLAYNLWDGTYWQLVKRTSADFATWSSEVNIAPGFGLPDLTAYRWCGGLSFVETTAGSELLLVFHYADSLDTNNNQLFNIYYSKSIDNGASFGVASKISNYDSFTSVGYRPSAVMVSSDNMYVAHTHETSALFIGENSTNWPPQYGGDSGYDGVSYIMLDAINQKLYAIVAEHGFVYNQIQGILEIDIATWTITRMRHFASTPAISSVFGSIQSISANYFDVGYGNKVIFGSGNHIGVWDPALDSFQEFHFKDNATYGVTKNVVGYPHSDIGSAKFSYDSVNNRVILVSEYTPGGLTVYLVVGYIDLSETGPEYTYHSLLDYNLGGLVFGYGVKDCVIDGNELWVSSANGLGDPKLEAYDFTSGSRVYQMSRGVTALPYNGLKEFVKYGDYIYGIFTYSSVAGYDDERGVCIINTANDNVHFATPAYKTADEYGFYALSINKDISEVYIGTSSDGVVIFNTATEQFTRMSNDEIPGITPDNSDNLGRAVYDQVNDRFFAVSSGIIGITTFLRDGKFKQSSYQFGTRTTDWSFTPEAPLTAGSLANDSWLIVDEQNVLWAFFQIDHSGSTDTDLAWDKLQPDFSLDLYLSGSIERVTDIDNEPNTLRFTLTHGHLFDKHNRLSLLSPYLRKGRKLTLKAGETVSSVDILVDQGVFYVDSTAMDYDTESYPYIEVTAKDKRAQWDDDEVVVIAYPSSSPETIITGLAAMGGLTGGDINIPTIPESFLLDAQWTDMSVNEAIGIITRRFGYFADIGVDGVFTIKKIDENASVDHVYTNANKIRKFSPDDSMSEFTNQLIVTGEEQDDTEVLFQEERIGILNGVAGWWGMKKEFDVYYSTDGSRRARYPRLKVLESVKGIGFYLAGQVDESISEIDPNEKYCVVKVDVPNLIPQLLAAITLYAFGNKIPDLLDLPANSTINWGRWIEGVGLYTAMMILGSTCGFQYEIWGRPVGYIRRSVEYASNDLEFQQELGRVVSKRVEGFACYNVGHCKYVGDYEMMILRLQRNKIKFEKETHLQDEAGDKITIVHPHTGESMDVIISKLQRTYEVGGTFTDSMIGWRTA